MRLVQRHGRIDRIGSRHREVFLRCFFPDQHLEALLGLEERLQRKLKQAAATGIGTVLPGVAAREITFTETREEIERLRAEESTLFEEGGASALSGEEYRRRIERAFTNPLTKRTVLSLPWGSGTGYTRPGADPGLVFCVRIGDHPKPWFRYVPLNSDLTVQVDPAGKPIVIDDTLACLAASDPADVDTGPVLTDEMYQAAFDAWAAAKSSIHAAWMFNADPANLTRPVPRVMATPPNSSAPTANTSATFRMTLWTGLKRHTPRVSCGWSVMNCAVRTRIATRLTGCSTWPTASP